MRWIGRPDPEAKAIQTATLLATDSQLVSDRIGRRRKQGGEEERGGDSHELTGDNHDDGTG